MPSLSQKITTILALLLLAASLPGCNNAERTGKTGTALPAASPNNRVRAKNIILMIGDGMGFNHYRAASLFLYGEPEGQPYAAFPVRVAMSTFAAGGQYDPEAFWASFDAPRHGATDSAAASTAMATGHKTYRYAVGVDTERRTLRNIVEAAEAAGRATGIITSVQFSHATPAGFGAHNPTRKNYEEIARDLLTESGLEVLMGAGHPWYDDSGRRREEPATFSYIGGESTWEALSQNTLGNDSDGDGIADPWTLIEQRESFRNLADGATPKRVVGIAPVARTLQQKRKQTVPSEQAFAQPLIPSVPTLAEMTRAALNVLDDDPDGFFLMVEGGAIDWASHANQSGRMIEEQVAFDHAVAGAIAWVETHSSWQDTLLIVTADHECGFLNGAGPADRWNPLSGKGMLQQPDLQWHSTGHTNALVPLFAKGAGAKQFRHYLLPKPDPVRGPYLDNTAVGKVTKTLLAVPEPE